ncbi:RpiB/LacA/LacB family sugar-phosphate isomerase [Cryobacterium sp. TMT1-66-1]|uniref:RpiB/LacA/LacB family sugar-phosphate isomerase n=1 Tax=Cryobacterium sp. TMT1-66-1 TaxID=1259242 RepID=UPI00106A8790|nr:RpiB/LacA/LacB family sugar-phosphate isomerase [Cryobacterium sp. TMT1-66-1]TFD08189.1 RpiB/LacA/LacB family sugar-phosphate isomerase [Cryobacterium sp. TMT1-66-1]
MATLARIAIAGDHHGTKLIDRIVAMLSARGHEVIDLAPRGGGNIDYPPLCGAVSKLVAQGDADLGIIVGGSGQGEVIACNKVRRIRAGLAYSEFAVDISRGNNDANVMVIGTKVVDDETACALLDRWLSTPFKGGVHEERLAQITLLEEGLGGA